MTAKEFPEPAGYSARAGFVKSNPLNNEFYIEQFKNDPWFPAILDAHTALTELVPGYNISQIKEKFGELRFYYHLPAGTPYEFRDKAAKIVGRATAWVDGFEYARRHYND